MECLSLSASGNLVYAGHRKAADDNEDYSKKHKVSFLTSLDAGTIRHKLTEDEEKALKKLTCFKMSDYGPLLVFGQDNSQPCCKIYGNLSGEYRICACGSGPVDSPQNIDNDLRAAMIAKSTGGSGGVWLDPADEMTFARMAKISELIGEKCNNPPTPDKTLEKLNPAFARKMEQEWLNSNKGT